MLLTAYCGTTTAQMSTKVDTNTVTISRQEYNRLYDMMKDYERMHYEIIDLRKIQLQYIKIDRKQTDYIEQLAKAKDSQPLLGPVGTLGIQKDFTTGETLGQLNAGFRVWRIETTLQYKTNNTTSANLTLRIR